LKHKKWLFAFALILGMSVFGSVVYAGGVAQFLTSFMDAVNQGTISPVLVGIALIGMSRVIKKIMVVQSPDRDADG
jgi:hypothetical protein